MLRRRTYDDEITNSLPQQKFTFLSKKISTIHVWMYDFLKMLVMVSKLQYNNYINHHQVIANSESILNCNVWRCYLVLIYPFINNYFLRIINININNKMSQSPVKRQTNFRKKQVENRRQWVGIKQYIRQFPLQIPQEITQLIHSLEPIHANFEENLSNLKVYKAALGAQMESSWLDFMEFLKIVVIKMNKKMEKTNIDKTNQIAELLNINSKYEQEKQALKDKIDTLEHLRELQSAELSMANQELKTSSQEISDIYLTLQKDMKKVTGYLSDLEATRAISEEKGSNQIYTSLEGLSFLLNSVEKEHKQTSENLTTMRELIKAMARTSKASTGTQVDESQLHTKASNIFTKNETKSISYEAEDGASLALPPQEQNHLIDRLKVKEKDTQPQLYKPQQNIDKPWGLSPTLLVFLENMSKENQTGRIIPYEYVKQLIGEIYTQRIELQISLSQGQIGNCMLFDEFVVHFFLKKYRIRRLAEVKLLEFVISLKYYSKFWIKVQTFCYLLDVMRYQPSFQVTDSNAYKCDPYAQNFFFTVYKVMSTYQTITQQDGTVYVELKKAKKLLKALLFFTQDMNRSRLMVKMEKQVRVFSKVDYVQFDFAMILALDEYFAVRKRIDNNISKAFTKVYERVQGYLSLDEMLEMFVHMEPIYRAGSNYPYKYPIDSELQVSKLYLYSITSSKNNYEINGNSFVESCQRYGFDSPFPFIHQCKKKQRKDQEGKQVKAEVMQIQSTINQSILLKDQPSKKNDEENQPQKIANRGVSINNERIDIAAKLFSQHFSILRQLKEYCDIFRSTLKNESNPQILWKSFNQIMQVIDKGCQFLKYPLLVKK